jgi:hypothetical protein
VPRAGTEINQGQVGLGLIQAAIGSEFEHSCRAGGTGGRDLLVAGLIVPREQEWRQRTSRSSWRRNGHGRSGIEHRRRDERKTWHQCRPPTTSVRIKSVGEGRIGLSL